jgi:hypothetical protein
LTIVLATGYVTLAMTMMIALTEASSTSVIPRWLPALRKRRTNEPIQLKARP